MKLIRQNKFTNLSQWGTRPEFIILPFLMCFSWHCPLHIPALFITRTLLVNNNSGFFPHSSSFERLPSITVAFHRTFHHLYASLWCFTALFVIWTLLFNNSGVFRAFHHLNASLPHQLRSPHFSSFAKFPAFSIIYTFPVLCLQVSLPSPFLPPPPTWSQVRLSVFFILCTHFPQFKFFSRLLSFTPVASFPVLTLS